MPNDNQITSESPSCGAACSPSFDHPTPRTDAVINTFDGNAPRLADKLATLAEEMERERSAIIQGWRSKAKQILEQAENMGAKYREMPSLWRIVAGTLHDCANELQNTRSCPEGSRKTSVDDDCASSPISRENR